jgi:hypothetical protein
MFYYLYEIKNLVNSKIYVGVHKTRNMNDGYMGSGKVIRSAIEKYGIENFQKVILETFGDTKAMYAREKEVVTEEFLAREDVYNLRRGGYGGFDYINKFGLNMNGNQLHLNAERHAELSKRGGNKAKEMKLGYHDPEKRHSGFVNKEHQLQMLRSSQSQQSKKKRMASFKKNGYQQGEKNSQFGTVWVTNEVENLKVRKNSKIPDGWRLGRTLSRQYK